MVPLMIHAYHQWKNGSLYTLHLTIKFVCTTINKIIQSILYIAIILFLYRMQRFSLTFFSQQSSPLSDFSNQARLLITCGFVAAAAVVDINKAMLIELSSLCHLLSRICLQEDNWWRLRDSGESDMNQRPNEALDKALRVACN